MLGYKRINCFNVKLNGRIKRFVKLLTKITYKIEKRLLNVEITINQMREIYLQKVDQALNRNAPHW